MYEEIKFFKVSNMNLNEPLYLMLLHRLVKKCMQHVVRILAVPAMSFLIVSWFVVLHWPARTCCKYTC